MLCKQSIAGVTRGANMATKLISTKDRVIRVITTEGEKQELRIAAARVSKPVAVFVREAALKAARANPAVKPDWASFFARDFGIPADWTLGREHLEDRDVFGLNSGGRHHGLPA